MAAAADHVGLPAVLKTRRFGYDGKGQVKIDPQTDQSDAFASIGAAPSILEGFVPFERELSVIIARGVNGDVAAFDAAENEHRNHSLWRSYVPGDIPAEQSKKAGEISTAIIEALDYVGVLGVEFFAMADGELLVNEIAPRVHNSGHWTQDASYVSQFEQHIRAVAGWPLGDPARHSDVCMENLIGDDVEAWDLIASEPQTRIHLYGKSEARPGRKMGHVNRTAPMGKGTKLD
jgi:5-(carboxyamino)imidazole ribonucleotide synthase